MSELQIRRYRSKAHPSREIEALHYAADRSNQQQVMGFLDARIPNPWATFCTSRAGGADELISVHGTRQPMILVAPDNIVVVYTDTHELEIHSLASLCTHHTLIQPQTKDTPVPDTQPETLLDFDPDSEYGQHRAKVFDALAILRSNPTAAHFELAASEIMDMLASAFNEGFDFGMETAQRNPYDSWNH